VAIDVYRLASLVDADDDPRVLLRAAGKMVCRADDGLRAAGYTPLPEATEIIRVIRKGGSKLSRCARDKGRLPIAREGALDAVWSHYLAAFDYVRMFSLQLRPTASLAAHLGGLATYACDCVAQAFAGSSEIDDHYAAIWAEERTWQEDCLEITLGIKQYGVGTRLRPSFLAERVTPALACGGST